MIKLITLTAASFALFTTVAQASEPTVLYDASGNAVVAYLNCSTVSSAVVLYTAERKPVPAYLQCSTPIPAIVVVKEKKGPIESIVTGTRSTARRVARRVSNRNDD